MTRPSRDRLRERGGEHESGASPADGGSVPPPSEGTPAPTESKFSIDVYQRPDGWWSFRINGSESHYRSSNQHGLERTVKALLVGAPKSAVTLKPLTVDSKPQNAPAPTGEGEGEQVTDAGAAWASLPTMSERLAAFLRRGKLSDPVPDERAE